jgi:uncharacterized protein YbcI
MVSGTARAEIANGFVRLHSQYYGRGPTKAKVYADGDVVVVVLEETFTPAERTLIEQGQSGGIQEIRRNFQQIMAEDFKALVEQATGRSIRSFISETDLENDIAVEVFLLSGARIDMAPFEQAGQDVPEEGSSG